MLFQLELAFWAFKGSPIRLVRTCFTPGVSDGIVSVVHKVDSSNLRKYITE